MGAELIYKQHLVERMTRTGLSLPGSYSYAENTSGQARVSSEAHRKWFYFQVPFSLLAHIRTRKKMMNTVTTQKKNLKSFWFHSPTLNLFHVNTWNWRFLSQVIHHFSFFFFCSDHPSTQIWLIIQSHINYTLCFYHLRFLSFFPGHAHTLKMQNFYYLNFHFPAPSKYCFISLLFAD